MMNDRFDAQLREHLLGTANARPAEGQLASLTQAVAATAQKHPLAARLTWFPGRVGGVPTRTLRYGLVALALIAATIFAAALYIGSQPARSTVFEGTWTSIDPGDGSTQLLVVAAGKAPAVRYIDERATGPACRQTPSKVYTAEGTGNVKADRQLFVDWPTGGGCGAPHDNIPMATSSFRYDQATDTILDNDGLSWRRADSAEAPPTRAPAPTATSPAEATPEPRTCSDLAGGTAYGVSVESRRITMVIPDAPILPWGGLNDTFRLLSPCRGGGAPITIRAVFVHQIPLDSCHDTIGDPATSWDDVIARFEAQLGHTTQRLPGAPTSINGYRVRAYQVAEVPNCPDGLALWDGTIMFGGEAMAYLVDLDGATLGVEVEYSTPLTEAEQAEVASIVASLRVDAPLGPQATDPGTSSPCIQYDTVDTYTSSVGSLVLTVTLPGTSDRPWRGDSGSFSIGRATCNPDDGEDLFVQVAIVDRVFADACHWKDSAVPVATYGDALRELPKEVGPTIVGPTATTLASHPATRYEVTVPQGFDKRGCDADPLPDLKLWNDKLIVPSIPLEAYLVDVDGVILGISVSYPEGFNAADRAQVDAILASLTITS
jgi:hypothetical protein